MFEPLNGCRVAVSLTVKDLGKSLVWYQDVLGFTVERRIEKGGTIQSYALRAGDVCISINQDDGAKGWDRIKGEGFSLRITTEQDIDRLAAQIKDRGGRLDSEPADMPWGARIFRLKDPDDFKITISSPRAATLSPSLEIAPQVI